MYIVAKHIEAWLILYSYSVQKPALWCRCYWPVRLPGEMTRHYRHPWMKNSVKTYSCYACVCVANLTPLRLLLCICLCYNLTQITLSLCVSLCLYLYTNIYMYTVLYIYISDYYRLLLGCCFYM